MADSEVHQKFEATGLAPMDECCQTIIEDVLSRRDPWVMNRVRARINVMIGLHRSSAFEAGMRAGEIARWIPVEEKLPEGAKDVLILYRASARSGLVDSRMAVGWLDGDGYWYGLHGHQSKPSEVTHWQPLPAAPEEKK